MTEENFKTLREGILRLEERLNNLSVIDSMSDFICYGSTLSAIETLGWDWERDENGNHKIIVAGIEE